MRQTPVQMANLKALAEQYQEAKQKLAMLGQESAVKLAGIEAEIASVKADQRDVRATRKLLQTSVKRLVEREKLLRDQIGAIQERLGHLQAERDGAVAEAAKNANAVAVLMVGSEVAQTERRLWDLRTALTVELEAERAELQRRLEENLGGDAKLQAKLVELEELRVSANAEQPGAKSMAEAEAARLKNEIDKVKEDNLLEISKTEETAETLQSELSDMTATKALYIAVRLIDPIGLARSFLVLIGVTVGLIVAVFIAWIGVTLED
jgi:chromosome segregation ATPase